MSGGSQGRDTNSLIEVAPTMAAMVEAWETPPETRSEVPSTAASFALNVADVDTEIALPAQPDIVEPIMATAPILAAPSIALQSTIAPQPPEPQKSPQELERIRLSKIPPTLKPKVVPAQPAPRAAPSKPVQKAASKKTGNPQPEATAQKTTAGRQAQTAAGTGGSQSAGRATSPASSGASNAKSKRLEAAWHERIRSRINSRQRYPRGAEGKSGTVYVRISLAASGQLRSVSIVKSSGVSAIDAAAIDAVKRSGRFPAVPKGVVNPTLQFNLPMRFNR